MKCKSRTVYVIQVHIVFYDGNIDDDLLDIEGEMYEGWTAVYARDQADPYNPNQYRMYRDELEANAEMEELKKMHPRAKFRVSEMSVL